MKTELSQVQAKFLPARETQRVYGPSRSTLYRLLAAKEIEAVKVGARTLFSVKSLDNYFATCPKA